MGSDDKESRRNSTKEGLGFMKALQAGLLGGTIVGFPVGFIVVAILALTSGNLYSAQIAKLARLIGNPPDTYIFSLLGLFLLALMFSMVFSIFGALTGLVFVAFVNRLPVQSTRVKASGFGLVMWLCGVVWIWTSMSTFHFILISLLALAVAISQALGFSYLFERWVASTKL